LACSGTHVITSKNTRKIYQNENQNANSTKTPKMPNRQKNTGFFGQLIRKCAIFIVRNFPRPEKEKKMRRPSLTTKAIQGLVELHWLAIIGMNEMPPPDAEGKTISSALRFIRNAERWSRARHAKKWRGHRRTMPQDDFWYWYTR
jgi:hypothetical protein